MNVKYTKIGTFVYLTKAKKLLGNFEIVTCQNGVSLSMKSQFFPTANMLTFFSGHFFVFLHVDESTIYVTYSMQWLPVY